MEAITVPFLLGQITAIESSYRGNTLLEELRVAGVDLWGINTLKDEEVLQAVVADEELGRRLQQAFDRTRDRLPVTPVRTPSPPAWPEAVITHFHRGRETSYQDLPPVNLWRSVRELSGASPVHQYPEATAASFWVQAMDRHGMARRLGPADRDRTNDQILHWLGIQKVPTTRPLRNLSPWSLGFSELPHEFAHPPTVPVEPGDLITYTQPLFAGAAILTGVTTEGQPNEALFLMGGDLCLGHPEVLGEFPNYHRPRRKRPDYLIVPRSPYDDPSVRRVLDLDEILEVEEEIQFDTPKFRTVHKSSGAGLSNEWVVHHQFEQSEYSFLHLTIERKRNGRRLVVVIDHYSGRKKTKEAMDRLTLFNATVEEMLTRVARSLGFDQLTLFYKMITPLSVLRGDGMEALERLGYRGANSKEWGRLPGKKIIIRNGRR